MNYSKKILLFLAVLGLFQTSVFARDYGHHNGVSLHLGGHHSGLSLNYSSPKNHSYHHQSKHYSPVYKQRSKAHYQHKNSQHLGYGYNKKAKKHYRKKNHYYQKPRGRSYNQTARDYYRDRNNDYQQPSYSNRNHYSSYNFVKQSNRHYHQNKQSCHPVTKIVTNHYGHSKNVGGTMCYDRYGDAYVVKGSRYNLH